MSSSNDGSRPDIYINSPSAGDTEKLIWIKNVKNALEDEVENDIVADVCVFQVPKSLSSINPEAYNPQLISLGPYHHLRHKLLEMERVKTDTAKRVHKGFNRINSTDLARKLTRLEPYIRACYHKFLELNHDVLAWMMAVDGLFLFDFICRNGIDKDVLRISEHLKFLENTTGRKLAEDAIMRDAMMLENQIPMFVLEKILTLECDGNEKIVQHIFPKILVRFCEQLSPIKSCSAYSAGNALKSAHLLDLLYNIVMQKEGEFRLEIPDDIFFEQSEQEILEVVVQPVFDDAPVFERTLCHYKSAEEVVQIAKNIPLMKPHAEFIEALMQLPFSDLQSSFRAACNEASDTNRTLIPTATSLAKAGIKFHETNGINSIRFDEETATFFLPVIKLGVNSEVIIRNLIAYEAMTNMSSLMFARFIELLDGIVDTEDDVKLLVKSGIIVSHLKEGEAAKLFNGMSKSIEVPRDSDMDKTIEKVNNFFNESPNIKRMNMLNKYLYRSWRVLVLLATAIVLLLMALQAFCSAYSCPRLFISSGST